jgi:hypothetical protein
VDLCAVEFGTEGVLELCEVMPLRRRRHPFSATLAIAVLERSSFGGWELAEVIYFVRSSLPRHFTNATVLNIRSHGVRCC